MTSYIIDPDSWLWEAYKETVPQSRTLDEPIIEYLAERVADDPRVEPELQHRAEQYLNGDREW